MNFIILRTGISIGESENWITFDNLFIYSAFFATAWIIFNYSIIDCTIDLDTTDCKVTLSCELNVDIATNGISSTFNAEPFTSCDITWNITTKAVSNPDVGSLEIIRPGLFRVENIDM